MALRAARSTALALGIVVLAWQVANAVRGRFVHDFLVADLAASPILVVGAILRADRRAAAVMLAGFAALGGIFLAATTMRLLGGGYDLGTTMTTLGFIPCLGWSLWLGSRLSQEERSVSIGSRGER